MWKFGKGFTAITFLHFLLFTYFILSIFSFNETSLFCASGASDELGNFRVISRQLAPS